MLEVGAPVNGRAARLQLMEKAVRDYRIPRMWWHKRSRYDKGDYESVGNRKYPLHGLAVLARGGSTLGWTGDAYRLKPEDFILRSRTGLGADWPITYDQLEPYYAQAEATLNVAGNSADDGHPPRSSDFPIPARPFHARDEPFRKLLAAHGWPPMHHNISLSGRGGVLTGDELIDGLETLAGFKLLTRVVAQRLTCSQRGRVDTVICRDLLRESTLEIAAERIVVCAGGIETPLLLLASANAFWPDGIGNDTGHVGQHLVSHTGLALGGRMRSRWFNGPIGATLATRHFDSPDHQRSGKHLLIWRPAPSGLLFINAVIEQFTDNKSSIQVGTGTTSFGTPRPVITLMHTDEHKAVTATIWSKILALAGQIDASFRFKRRFVHAHPMCTCRMADDPAQGVTDANLRVHGVENLFLCGSAVFSSGGASNPTVTIAALAHRLGEHLSVLTAPENRH